MNAEASEQQGFTASAQATKREDEAYPDAADPTSEQRQSPPVGGFENPVREFEALLSAPHSRETETAAGVVQHLVPTQSPSATPLFIVGSPRSGTSILTSALLSAGYHGFQEGNFLPLMQIIGTMIERHIQTYANGNDKVMASLVDWGGFRRDINGAFRKQVDALNPVTPWMDKSGNPEMIKLIPKLQEVWPSAIFIFAKRRAIENLISRMKKFPGHTFEYHCKDWAMNMTAWRSMRELPGLRAIEIDQQDMIRDPGGVATKLANFIGCGKAERDRLEAVLRGDRPQQTEAGSADRVIDVQDAGWSPSQLEIFLKTCWPEMQNYGYGLNRTYWDAES